MNQSKKKRGYAARAFRALFMAYVADPAEDFDLGALGND
jgi:hypothetical protein